jgi:hypothetical protein
MNSFWDRLYDKFKDRRYGTLFLFTVLALVGLPIVLVIIDAILREFNLENYFLDALPGIGLLALTWGFLTFRRAQARRREKLQHPPLSRDELRVARSKLVKGQSLKKI